MARGARKRTWVKMFCDGCLHGSINYQLELAEQAVFYKLVMYSAVCGGEAGIISDNDGRPLPHWFISNELHAPLDILESTLKKCIKEGRISENDTGIVITNWTYYQSEYERQKQYREKATGKKTPKVCPTCDYKALTNEEYCPQCLENGKDILLQRDYKGQKYGKLVQQ